MDWSVKIRKSALEKLKSRLPDSLVRRCLLQAQNQLSTGNLGSGEEIVAPVHCYRLTVDLNRTGSVTFYYTESAESIPPLRLIPDVYIWLR